MMTEVNLLVSADENYARYCAVTLLSVLSNMARPGAAHVYLLSPNLSSESGSRLKALCSSFGAKITVLAVDLALFSGLSIKHKHFSLNNYSRLYGPNLCLECDRLLYLDSDLIAVGDVENLFQTDLAGKPIAAVPHVSLPYQREFVKRFPVADSDIYFNSGVMVIDAAAWREKNAFEQILSIADCHADALEFADQDPLNVYFWGNYFHLPGGWNVESRLYREKLLGLFQNVATQQRLESPQIVHFTGTRKPWSSRDYVPMRHLYRRYSDALSTEFDWCSARDEPRRCSFRSLLTFGASCLHFRLGALKQRVFATT